LTIKIVDFYTKSKYNHLKEIKMKDILTDIVAHTHNLGILPLVKITGENGETVIESMAEDRSVILNAKTKKQVAEFDGVFGMPNLDKLNLHLKNPEYKENAKIEVVKAQRNGVDLPVGLHFENSAKDFVNDYRFMNSDIINEKLKTVKFKGATWDVEFAPTMAAVGRLKLQAGAHTEENVFQVKVDNGNLVFFFGDASTHAGSFTFQAGVTGKLKQTWSWPVSQVMNILNLDGDKTMRIADAGAMQITVDSGLAEYNYILPAQSK
jgi:hypothetical protein